MNDMKLYTESALKTTGTTKNWMNYSIYCIVYIKVFDKYPLVALDPESFTIYSFQHLYSFIYECFN